MATAHQLFPLLKEVSRSFYLTLRVLPASVRPQIGLAYLLARATDTIADTELISVEERLNALSELRARILGKRDAPLDFRVIAVSQPDLPKRGDGEAVLLSRIEEAIACLREFSAEDQARIRDVLTKITSGQELDLRRFGKATADSIVALQTDAELDDYTYRVAGCVGEFWTKMCRAHVFPQARLDDEFLLRNGVRFGKGLQLVNILRDLPRDLISGRSYLPAERLARVGLRANDLRSADTEPQLRPVYNELLDAAEAHLRAGWDYTNALPRSAVRVRLACAWPILIGIRTLAQLRSGNRLDATRRIKVSRIDVRRVITSSVLRYPFAANWRALFDAHRNAATSPARR
jgi:farnesyl-diphosphate farnesyltransferase